ncbi:hypothetical protein WS69_18845 [Burkholderia sp. BDU5]|nr:hypothetical protein WS69_18845 [Burkholderia sp. BDU5]
MVKAHQIGDLTFFVLVARHGSLSAAARVLDVRCPPRRSGSPCSRTGSARGSSIARRAASA